MRVKPRHYILAVIVVLLFSLVYGGRGYMYAVLYELRLVPLEERVTELYFTDSATLPVRSDRPATFSFTIHNREGRDMVYRYTITALVEDARVLLFEKSVPIPDGEFLVLEETSRALGATRIILELETGQKISFNLRSP